MAEFIVGAGIILAIMFVIGVLGWIYCLATMDTGFEWSTFGGFVMMIIMAGVAGCAFVLLANAIGHSILH